jgi:competence protein ComEA
MKKLLLALVSALLFSIPVWAAVDINKASQAELESVKGIGPKKAQAIIEYRKKNGEFKSVDELDKVPGFGKKSVDMLKKDISVGSAKAAAAGKTEKTVKVAKDNKASK